MNQLQWETRTDLALEITENLKEKEIQDGISIEVNYAKGQRFKETIIRILNETGEKTIGKPQGTYITMEGEDLSAPDDSFHKDMSKLLSGRLEKIIKNYSNILVVGLGNDQITSDSIGPKVVKNLFVTRHLLQEGMIEKAKSLAGFIPGVTGQTGMEAVEIIRGVVNETNTELVVVIDALAARKAERLNRTIQICDTGITPGSGVGNHRKEISKRTIGADVIAIGVPTVISVPTLVKDALSILTKEEEELDLSKYILPDLSSMYVSPKNVDEAVKKISFTISEAINGIVI